MVYGYTRVSRDTQDGARQHSDILEWANTHQMIVAKWIEEVVSSRNGERAIFTLIGRLDAGDVVLVTELSRIGRSMREINGIVSSVSEHKASIVTINNGQRLGEGMDVAGEALLFALGIGAQVERDLISERTKSGLRAAKASGKRLGRPPGKSKLDARADEIARYQAASVPVAAIARIIGCSRGALVTWLSRRPHA